MPRKKKPIVEIVRASEVALVPKRLPENLQMMLDRMVRDRVTEIMAEQGVSPLEIDFQPREVSYERQRRQTVFERRKWALYFEKFGCRMCGKKKVSHASSGHCQGCHAKLTARLAKIRRDFERANPEAEINRKIDRLTSSMRSARALLGEGE